MKKQLSLIIIIFFGILSLSHAEIIKPNKDITPKEVVKIQLHGLMTNNKYYDDSGIEQTWEFAHPNNQRVTGPLNRFKNMIKGAAFVMLLDHTEHNIVEIYSSEKLFTFEVTILDKEKKYYKFKWQVEKYIGSGPLNNCWLTTAVSNPIEAGSSI